MAETTTTLDEITDSLTGHDELNVHTAFGADVADLVQTRKTIFMRAMIAVHYNREGGDAFPLAYRKAMDLTMKDVIGFFSEQADDFDPDQPDSDAGKDA
jgi:hypothetical protein